LRPSLLKAADGAGFELLVGYPVHQGRHQEKGTERFRRGDCVALLKLVGAIGLEPTTPTSVAMIERHYGHLRSDVAAGALARLVL
jgi:hypothetical protein